MSLNFLKLNSKKFSRKHLKIYAINKKFEKLKLLALDFDGVLTDNKVITDENGKESVFCDRGDGLGIELLRQKTDMAIVVLSKEKNKVVEARCRKLGIECLQGVENKLKILMKEIEKRKLDICNVCFVGNDINDIECLKKVGVGIGVADSHIKVLEAVDYITIKRGGNGAVREICDFLLNIKEMTSSPH